MSPRLAVRWLNRLWIGRPMMESGRFPMLAVHMILVGEETGRLDEMLLKHFPLAPGQANPNELPDRATLG